MNTEETYLIFGYGSLMNKASQERTICDGTIEHGFDVLNGYRRIFNLQFGEHVYLNIEPVVGHATIGFVIEVTAHDLEHLKEREVGYDFVDVSAGMTQKYDKPVYTFIAPTPSELTGQIKQSYINMCLDPLIAEIRQEWFDSCVITSDIMLDEESLLQ